MRRLTPAKPQRTCVSCRKKTDQDQLLRVAKAPDGAVALGRKAQGRGAYICPTIDCWNGAQLKGRLDRVLRARIDSNTLQRINEEISCKLR